MDSVKSALVDHISKEEEHETSLCTCSADKILASRLMPKIEHTVAPKAYSGKGNRVREVQRSSARKCNLAVHSSLISTSSTSRLRQHIHINFIITVFWGF